jgi:hypothetical protein
VKIGLKIKKVLLQLIKRCEVLMDTQQLTIEQQFKLQVLKERVKTLTLEEAQGYLIELLTQSMIKDNLLAQWIKK